MDVFNLTATPPFDFIRSGLSTVNKFLTENEKQQYNHNSNIFNKEYWKYADPGTITYVHNSDGFREPREFDTIDWEKTSVVIGCSFTYGQACEFENTVSEILTREYGVHFVNGGIPGSSNKVIHNNAIAFMKKYNPKKVIIIWSHPTRNTWVHAKDNRTWEHETILPATVDAAYRKDKIKNYNVPQQYFDSYCLDTVHQWKLAIEAHALLGNKQYYVIDKYINQYDDANWIKPKDMTLYDMKLELDCGNISFSLEDLQTPEPYELINSIYGRDLHYVPAENRVKLGHFGEQMNRDIADLIYRENFI